MQLSQWLHAHFNIRVGWLGGVEAVGVVPGLPRTLAGQSRSCLAGLCSKADNTTDMANDVAAAPGERRDQQQKHVKPFRASFESDLQSATDQLAHLSLSPATSPLPSKDLSGVAQLLLSGAAKKVLVMVGAGISTAAGIPDFRTPGTGLYSQLERYNLPFPEAVFSLNYFKANPKPFYLLAKELFPGSYLPTPTHHFLHLLHQKGQLLRVFTQNIDGLEQQAGLPLDMVVNAHGSFDGAHCADCKASACLYALREAVLDDRVLCCARCGGSVKPDIVFFGEALPARFHRRRLADLPEADLLLVMGTSLAVEPFASMIVQVPDTIPRVLINKHPAGCSSSSSHSGSDTEEQGVAGNPPRRGFNFESGVRDVLHLGDCDSTVWQLSEMLGWREELQQLVDTAAAEAALMLEDC